ncbi:hypothetical protein V6N13_088220 [Hibiscus sabdariffa]
MAEQGGLEGNQPVDLSKHPSGIVPTLQNIVSTVNLDCKLDLKQIALQARNAEYNPKRFAAVIMRIREPKTTALIFASGKMVCTGAKSEQQSKLAARKYARIIQKLGFPAKFKDFKIQNIVGSCDVKFPIRLEGLAYSHGAFSSVSDVQDCLCLALCYEPELFPGLIYRMKQPKIVLLIFVSGKIVITGAKVRDETYTAFENIYPVLTEFRKNQQWSLISSKNIITNKGFANSGPLDQRLAFRLWMTYEGSDADVLKDEIRRVKEEEEHAMREALGLTPKRSSQPQGNRLDKA